MADISKFSYEGSETIYNLKDAQARKTLEEVSVKTDNNGKVIKQLAEKTSVYLSQEDDGVYINYTK